MSYDDLVEYHQNMLENAIYEWHLYMRLIKEGSLEFYEDGKWVPARESKNSLAKEFGVGIYKEWKKWIIQKGLENSVIGWRRERLWARWVEKTIFTLIGMVITILSLFLQIPIGLFIGVPLSLLSLYIKYMEVSEPPFLSNKKLKKK